MVSMGWWRRIDAWTDRHWRLVVALDVLFLVVFWSIAARRNDGWGYFYASLWTLRTLFEWFRLHRKRQKTGVRQPAL
jgi:hypothetical protein